MMKQNKYDDQNFFEKYSAMDRSVKGLSGAGEWPALQKMLPSFANKRILDLGCGFGWHCQYAVEHGALSALGIDISQKMIDTARQKNNSSRITYNCQALEDIDFPSASFDLVISSLTFHYIKSFKAIAQKVYNFLVPGGEFIFSVEHPIFTAQGPQQWITDSQGHNLYWPVDNYFNQGPRNATFLGEEVIKYHKTLTTYISELLQAGFEITGLTEPMPTADALKNIPEMKDELRRPMMLIISARKK